MYLMPLNHTLKMIKMVNFVMHILPHFLKVDLFFLSLLSIYYFSVTVQIAGTISEFLSRLKFFYFYPFPFAVISQKGSLSVFFKIS